MADEQDLDIMEVPSQALEPEMAMRAVSARTEMAARWSRRREEVEQVDKKVDRAAKKQQESHDLK